MEGKIEIQHRLTKKSPPTYVLRDNDTYPYKLYIAGSVIERTLTICISKFCDVIMAPPSGEKLNFAIRAQQNWAEMLKNECQKRDQRPIYRYYAQKYFSEIMPYDVITSFYDVINH